MPDHDPRLDLPSSSTPPVEGRQWMLVKIGVWSGAIVLMIAVAALFARIATDVVGSGPKLTLPEVNLESLVKGDPERRRDVTETPVVEEAGEAAPSETVGEQPTPADGEAGLITRPAWTIQPTADYPPQAARAGIEQGAVTMNCGVTVEGWLSGCRIVSETPPGHGFADATLRGAQGARMRPPVRNGEPFETRVEYTTRYLLE